MDLQITQFAPEVFGLYKPAGFTPLQSLQLLRAQRPELAKEPLTYAGRLDPMAKGLLLVLAGKKVHEKDVYIKLDKTYEVNALLGMETDSFDLLGLPTRASRKAASEQDTTRVLHSFVGKAQLPLPVYSSPPHNGKPLFWWAKQKLPTTMTTPIRETTIHNITDIHHQTIQTLELLQYVKNTIASIDGDFRQDTILHAWQEMLPQDEPLQTISFTVTCSSGTYIRSLVHELGKTLGTGACVYTLTRTHIGPYSL